MGATLPTFSRKATGLRVAVVVSRYNPEVCEGLLQGATRALQELEISHQDQEVFRVPGAFELPWAAQQLARSGRWDAVVCLGAVIRGETSHYDYVCQGVTSGVMQAMLTTNIPMAFGVLTTDNDAQAEARARDDEHNKGREAALTAVEMAWFAKESARGN